MKKLTKRRQEIVDKINSGWVLVTAAEQGAGTKASAQLSKPGSDEVDHIQLALFWGMVQDGIIVQQMAWPFNFELTDTYENHNNPANE